MNLPFGQKRVVRQQNLDNCKVKIKRDKQGRIREIETSGKCNPSQLKVAKQQLGINNIDSAQN